MGHVHTAPREDVQEGNRQEQKQQIASKKAGTVFGSGPANEEIAQEDKADNELNGQVSARHMDMVAGDDLPRNGSEEHQACGEFDGAERIGKISAGGIGKEHTFVIFTQ